MDSMNRNGNGTYLFLQFCRFGIVGLTATLIHYSIVVELVQKISMQPLIANIFAFLIAFQMSYWGHRLWTFNDSVSLHRDAFPKLLLVQSLNFTINESLFYILMTWGLPY